MSKFWVWAAQPFELDEASIDFSGNPHLFLVNTSAKCAKAVAAPLELSPPSELSKSERSWDHKTKIHAKACKQIEKIKDKVVQLKSFWLFQIFVKSFQQILLNTIKAANRTEVWRFIDQHL